MGELLKLDWFWWFQKRVISILCEQIRRGFSTNLWESQQNEIAWWHVFGQETECKHVWIHPCKELPTTQYSLVLVENIHNKWIYWPTHTYINRKQRQIARAELSLKITSGHCGADCWDCLKLHPVSCKDCNASLPTITVCAWKRWTFPLDETKTWWKTHLCQCYTPPTIASVTCLGKFPVHVTNTHTKCPHLLIRSCQNSVSCWNHIVQGQENDISDHKCIAGQRSQGRHPHQGRNRQALAWPDQRLHLHAGRLCDAQPN